MKLYIGTKIILAEPQTTKEGRDGYKVVYEDGYTSWSPKDTFERAYRLVTPSEVAMLDDVAPVP